MARVAEARRAVPAITHDRAFQSPMPLNRPILREVGG